MKRWYLMAGLVLWATTSLGAAGQSLGLGALISWTSEGVSSGTNTANESDLSFGLFAPWFLSDSVEVTPTFTLAYHSESDPNPPNLMGGGTQADWNQLGFSFGAGAYFSMVKAGPLGVKIGGDAQIAFGLKPSGASAGVQDGYFNPSFTLSLPLILDLALNPNLVLRISQTTASLSLARESYSVNGTESSSGSFTFRSFQQGFTPRFAFYFIFK